MEKERINWLDWLRFIACFMVMLVHSIEPFYLGDNSTAIASQSDALWTTLVNSALRPCVPLFAMASSYLLFPVKTDAWTFYKKRMVRVLIPFVIWSLAYALVYKQVGNLIFNFTPSGGHLWFVYMLLGIYLIMPVLSPWIEKVSRKEEEIVLAIWGFTTIIPFISKAGTALGFGGDLWGECPWNVDGTFYYISGFVGYLILGHYFKTYVPELSWKKTLAIAVPLFAAGYALAAGWFWQHIPDAAGYPVNDAYEHAVEMERGWNFCSVSVSAMTIAYFLLIRKITSRGWFYNHVVLPVSKASYGMYLMHMFFLATFVGVFKNLVPMPVCMLLTALCSYICCAVVAIAVQKIPKVGKYIVG